MTPALAAVAAALQHLGVTRATSRLLVAASQAGDHDAVSPVLLHVVHQAVLLLHHRVPRASLASVEVSASDSDTALEHIAYVMHLRGFPLPVAATAKVVLTALLWLAVDARLLLLALPPAPEHIVLATALGSGIENASVRPEQGNRDAACPVCPDIRDASNQASPGIRDQLRLLLTRLSLRQRQAQSLADMRDALASRYQRGPHAGVPLRVVRALRQGDAAIAKLTTVLAQGCQWRRLRLQALQSETDLCCAIARLSGERVLLPRCDPASLADSLADASAAISETESCQDQVHQAWRDLNADLSKQEQASLLAALEPTAQPLRSAIPSFSSLFRAALQQLQLRHATEAGDQSCIAQQKQQHAEAMHLLASTEARLRKALEDAAQGYRVVV